MSQADLDAAQALADVAAVGLVQQRLARETGLLAEQLESALQSRPTIEQAKGILAVKAHVSISQAFGILEAEARASSRSVVSLAQDVVDRTLVWRDGALRQA
ncbi:MAG: ANTAR domain-containing protein [Candidatus Nanopelagicales bacterium]